MKFNTALMDCMQERANIGDADSATTLSYMINMTITSGFRDAI